MIIFTSEVFDTRTGHHPADPAIVGKPVADWLRQSLIASGARADGLPEPNDAGWVFEVEHDGREFLVGVSGSLHPGEPRKGDYSILVQTRSSFLERFTGGPDAAVDDPLILLIESLLVEKARATDVAVLIDG